MAVKATKAHILEATIMAIEKHGLHHITTRLIADCAGVNNAALHYYFGTKDQLVAEAMSLTLRHMGDDLGTILARDLPLRDNLEEAFEYLFSGTVRYPNLVRAHMFGPLNGDDTANPGTRQFGEAIASIASSVRKHKPDADSTKLSQAIHAAITSGLFSALAPDILSESTEVRLGDEAARRAFIRFLTEMILSV